MIRMKYKVGSGFYIGIPARDLNDEEVEFFGRDFLLSLGLYEEVAKLQKQVKKDKEQED